MASTNKQKAKVKKVVNGSRKTSGVEQPKTSGLGGKAPKNL
jgi:hypothetical protein